MDHGNPDLELTEEYKDLGSTEEEIFLVKAVTEIQMLLKYLKGFYFGNLIVEGDSDIKKTSKKRFNIF